MAPRRMARGAVSFLLSLAVLVTPSAANYDIHVCEGHHGSIECSPGTSLRITLAKYGRADPIKCAEEAPDHLDVIFGCPMRDVTAAAQGRCDGKVHCSLSSTAADLGAAGQCPDIYKYLHVRYECATAHKALRSKCTHETPASWPLRFRSDADSVAKCEAKCISGGGNGYFCLSRARGLCLCGTEQHPVSLTPASGTCGQMCEDGLCGGVEGEFSCYVPASMVGKDHSGAKLVLKSEIEASGLINDRVNLVVGASSGVGVEAACMNVQCASTQCEHCDCVVLANNASCRCNHLAKGATCNDGDSSTVLDACDGKGNCTGQHYTDCQFNVTCTDCTKTCGDSVQTCQYVTLKPAEGNGKPCPTPSQFQRPCSMPRCMRCLDSEPRLPAYVESQECSVNGTGTPVCALTCAPGYNRTRDTVCVDGDWLPGICAPKMCVANPPPPPNSTTFKCGKLPLPHGSVCSYNCPANAHKYLALQCDRGNWTKPQCVIDGCLPPVDFLQPRYGTWPQECTLPLQFGSTCTIDCGVGFIRIGGPAVCDSITRVWKSIPQCIPIVNEDGCKAPPAIPAGVPGVWDPLPQAGAHTGEHVYFWCKYLPGKNFSAGMAICDGGAWTLMFDPAICQPGCDGAPPAVANGFYENSTQCLHFPSGDTCRVNCSKGFYKAADARCVRGVWKPGMCTTNSSASCSSGELPVLPHGTFADCAIIPEHSLCLLTCPAGYRKNGDAVCWQGHLRMKPLYQTDLLHYDNLNLIGCEPLQCNLHPSAAIVSGSWNNCGVKETGQYCVAHCVHTCYRPNAAALCVNGAYVIQNNLTTVTCVPRGCDAPPVIDHGVIKCPGGNFTAHGAVCNQTCDDGFALADGRKSFALTCQGCFFTPPACVPAGCLGDAPDVANGTWINCVDINGVRRCELTCNEGYEPEHQYAFCQAGKWQNFPRCLVMRCNVDAPQTLNGITNCWGSIDRSVCTPICNDNWYANDTATCVNGRWIGKPSCAPRPCQVPVATAVLNGAFNCSVNYPEYVADADTCTVTCKPGYAVSGQMKCKSAIWQMAECGKTPCVYPPVVRNAEAAPPSCGNAPSGETCTITCLPGYVKTGGPITCVDGTWALAPICVEMPCSDPPQQDVPHGKWVWKGHVISGGYADWECNAGYYPKDPTSEAYCYKGVWQINNNTFGCQALPCAKPPTAPAKGTFANNCTNVQEGQICPLVCSPGLTATGDSVCFKGAWTAVSCVNVTQNPMACQGPPPPVINGTYYDSCNILPHGGSCRFNCIAGYTPVQTTCTFGQWRPGRCAAASCVSQPPKLENGHWWDRCAPRPNTQACWATCNPGYTNFNTWGFCRMGRWEVSNVRCVEPPCWLHAPREGAVLPGCNKIRQYYESGTDCAAQCSPGWVLQGALKCMKGTWTSYSCLPSPCTTPPVIGNNGTWACSLPVAHGGHCSVICPAGYMPQGYISAARGGGGANLFDPYTYCQAGNWSVVTCAAKACRGLPPSPNLGTYATGCANGISFGGKCALQCPKGYIATGTAVCGDDPDSVREGKWQTEASCQPAPCAKLSLAAAASIDPVCSNTTVPHGTTCDVVCANGYQLDGRPRCEYSLWTNAVCRPKPCPATPAVTNGQWDPSCSAGQPHTGRCFLTCKDGFELNTAEPAYCSLGNWTRVPVCNPSPCRAQPPLIPNGKWSIAAAAQANGVKAAYTCVAGYVAKNATPIATCTNGVWVYDPINVACTPLGCKDAPAASWLNTTGKFATNCVPADHGEICGVTCNAPYTKTRDAECQFGTWTKPQCIALAPTDCKGPPLPKNQVSNGGYVDCQGVRNAGTCTLLCNSGYTKTGDATCTNGKWVEPLPTCAETKCTDAPGVGIPYGTFPATCANSAAGTKCVPVCQAGTVAIGAAVCTMGVWDRTTVVCQPLSCPTMTPALVPTLVVNAQTIDCANLQANGSTPHDALCTVTCTPGYILQGAVKCWMGAYQKWATCTAAVCSEPPPIENGIYATTCRDRTGLNGTCAPQCNPGYELTNPTATCVLGNWINPPSCVPSNCSRSAVHGVTWGVINADCTTQPPGGECGFTCNNNFDKMGNLTCTNRGVWNYTDAWCRPARCPFIYVPNVPYGHEMCSREANSSTYAEWGERCPYSCLEGYRHSGDLYCANGVWTKAQCIVEPCWHPPPIVHGWYQAACHWGNYRCTLTCDWGYEADNGTVAICEGGKWSVAPQCRPANCTTYPIAPAQVVWTPNGTLPHRDGDVMGFKCAAGYSAVDASAVATCVRSSWQFDDTVIKCGPASCALPPADNAVVNGTFALGCNNVPHDSVCEMKCAYGFNKTGDALCVRGVWQLPKCAKITAYDCPKAPNATANGKFSCSATLHTQSCPLICNTGYTKSSDAVCVEGKYTSSPTCQPNGCASPPPSEKLLNGIFDQMCSNSTNGTTCQHKCTNGYTARGLAYCKLGNWEIAGVACDPNPCTAKPDPVQNGTVKCPAQILSGSVCTVACDDGFTLIGDVKCTLGNYSVARCAPNPCMLPPPIDNGVYPDTCKEVTGTDGRCQPICNDGFDIGDNTSSICRAGKWIQTPVCVPKSCPDEPADPKNGEWKCPTALLHNATCWLNCTDGYDAFGEAVCLNGHWKGASGGVCEPRGCPGIAPQPSGGGTFVGGNCGNMTHGQVCVVQCPDGYIASGDVVCRYGNWSQVNCTRSTKNDCFNKPQDPANGNFDDCQHIYVGGVCPLTCKPGYKPAGGAVCANGNYDVSNAKCDPLPCQAPPKSKTANSTDVFSCSGSVPHNVTCPLECAAGYEAEGSALCIAGSWINTNVKCVPKDCQGPPATLPNSNGWTSCAEVPHGSVCKPVCKDGYIVRGSVECSLGQFQLNNPGCDPKPCTSKPVIDDTMQYVNPNCTFPTQSGATCQIMCKDGYVISSTAPAKCNLGQWGSIPTCTPASCAGNPPAVLEGSWTCSQNTTGHGGSCQVNCDKGYAPEGQSVCQYGLWVGTTLCNPIGCATPPASPNNGRYNATVCSNVAHQFDCTLECLPGYVKTNDAECLHGTWTTAECHQPKPSDCTAPPTVDPANGHYEQCTDVAHNGTCPLICDEGYTQVGNAAACNNGTWMDWGTKCEPKGCAGAPPSVQGGAFPANCTGLLHGAVCPLECTGKLVKLGDAVCQLGKWSMKEAICEHLSCNRPPVVANGAFPGCQSTTKHGDDCEVVCERPFVPSAPQADCFDGQWVLPKCLEPQCLAPPTPPTNGDYKGCDTTPSGDECVLNCNPGYIKTGDATCRNGSWTGEADQNATLPICNPLPCKKKPETVVDNGNWACSDLVLSGGVCALDCFAGYDSTGSAICQAGQWIATDRKCLPEGCDAPPSPPRLGSFDSTCGSTPHDGVCSLTCVDGYKSTGEAVCKFGSWVVPSCAPIPCSAPPSIGNGAVLPGCADTDGNNGTCGVLCNEGYILANATQNATVCSAGKWNFIPTCVEAGCSATPNPVPLGTWNCSSTAPNATCALQCNNGYQATASATCNVGVWTSNLAKCEEQGCATGPGTVGNGSYAANCANSKPGDVCVLTCNNDFVKTKNAVCAKGTWDLGQCHEELDTDCTGAPGPSPANGNYDQCLNVEHLDNCTLRCSDGYVASRNATCNDGNWILGTCTPLGCPNAPTETVINGQLNTTCAGAIHGDGCAVTCNPGTIKAGDAVCLLGKWDMSMARCDYKPCGEPPVPPSGSLPGCLSNAKHGSVCELICKQGYTKSGDAKCVDGTWEVPKCEPPLCTSPPINPEGGTYGAECDDVTNGTVCILQCPEGYTKVGDAVCVEGSWKPTNGDVMPACSPKPCNRPPGNDIENGDWKCTGIAQSGDQCELDCDTGFQSTGSAICQAGVWKNTDRTCMAKPCLLGPIAPNYGTYPLPCVNQPDGATCQLNCDTGFTPTGPALCKKGSWNNPTCAENQCTKAPILANGEAAADCLNDTTSTFTCRVLCNAGFILPNGNDVAQCSRGEWVVIPQCAPAPCLQPPAPVANGRFECSGGRDGDKCTLMCADGYVKAADAQCQKGQWVGGANCQPKQCVDLPIRPDFGTFDPAQCTNKDDGQTCALTCQKGYAKTEDFTCRLGNWSKPECRKNQTDDCTSVPFPDPEHGNYDVCGDIPNAGKCPLTCDEGFVKTQDAYCRAGVYELGDCIAKNCTSAPQNPLNGYFQNCTLGNDGDMCNVTCSEGYQSKGVAMCVRGVWDVTAATCDPADCQTLPDIPMGIVNCTGMQPHNTECAVICGNNYTSTGPAVCVKGQWRTPTCNPPPCKDLPVAPANGQYSPDCVNVADGAVCALACNAGYSKGGDAVCQKGQWGSNIAGAAMPTCKPNGCTGAPASGIENGKWDCISGLGTGDACPLVCDQGFIPSGSALCVGAVWTQTSQTCLPKSCDKAPENPPHGTYATNCSMVADSSVCVLKCEDGFLPSAEAVCVRGSWRQAICNPAPCIGAPATVNGWFDASCTDVSGTGGKCTLNCDDGYVPNTAEPSAICTAGNWTFIPECVPAGCKTAPPPVTNSVEWLCTKADHNTSCAVTCKEGFTLTGDAWCFNGKWTSTATCAANPCHAGPSNPPNGTHNGQCANVPSGQTCEVICNDGFTKSLDSMCSAGKWLLGNCVVAVPSDCIGGPETNPTNGVYTECGAIPSGSACPLLCNPGYDKVADAKCWNGTWTEGWCTAKNCTVPPATPPNAVLVAPANCTNATSGSDCPIACADGYEYSAFPICRFGVWDLTGVECKPAACVSTPSIEFGSVSCNTVPINHSGICNVTCNDGYVSSLNYATCLQGKWTLPKCVPLCVIPPANPKNGSYAGNGACANATENSNCPLTCDVGYTKTGDIICKGGSWIGNIAGNALPKCEPMGCAAQPRPIQLGIIPNTCKDVPHGFECPITCTGGRVKTGNPICQYGSWTVVQCKIADPCAGVVCTVPAALQQCTASATCQGGNCVLVNKAQGTSCDDGNTTTAVSQCNGQGSCLAIDMCEEVECPYAMDGCHTDGVCNPATGDCDSGIVPDDTPCDDGNVTTSHDTCKAGVCTGIPGERTGLGYGGFYGYWGYACCLTIVSVIDAPGLSVVELYATQDPGDLSRYSLEIDGIKTGNQGAQYKHIDLPPVIANIGDHIFITNNASLFQSTFNYVPQHLYALLPVLQGNELIHLLRTGAAHVHYQVSRFPPDDSHLLNWADGYGYLDRIKGWQANSSVLVTQQDLSRLATLMPFNKFNVFNKLKHANCTCQAAKAVAIVNGIPACNTAATTAPLTSFQMADWSPMTEFGAMHWTFAQPGVIDGMDGTWVCNVTMV